MHSLHIPPPDTVNILIRSKATNYITSIALIQFDVIPPRTKYLPTLHIEHRACNAMPFHVTAWPPKIYI